MMSRLGRTLGKPDVAKKQFFAYLAPHLVTAWW